MWSHKLDPWEAIVEASALLRASIVHALRSDLGAACMAPCTVKYTAGEFSLYMW